MKLLRAGHEGLAVLLEMKRAADDVFSQDNAAYLAGWINRNRDKHGKNFPHLVTANDGVLINGAMEQRVWKPAMVEPSADLIDLLAA